MVNVGPVGHRKL